MIFYCRCVIGLYIYLFSAKSTLVFFRCCRIAVAIIVGNSGGSVGYQFLILPPYVVSNSFFFNAFPHKEEFIWFFVCLFVRLSHRRTQPALMSFCLAVAIAWSPRPGPLNCIAEINNMVDIVFRCLFYNGLAAN